MKTSGNSYSSAIKLLTGLIVAGVVLGLEVGYYIARQVKGTAVAVVERLSSLQQNDVSQLEAGIRALSPGDLTMTAAVVTQPIQNPGKDEPGVTAPP
jgi:hypothetical protein